MIAAVEAKLLQDAGLVRTTSALVTPMYFRQIFAFGTQTHTRCLGNHEYESTYCQTPRPTQPLGNIYPESTRPTGAVDKACDPAHVTAQFCDALSGSQL